MLQGHSLQLSQAEDRKFEQRELCECCSLLCSNNNAISSGMKRARQHSCRQLFTCGVLKENNSVLWESPTATNILFLYTNQPLHIVYCSISLLILFPVKHLINGKGTVIGKSKTKHTHPFGVFTCTPEHETKLH